MKKLVVALAALAFAAPAHAGMGLTANMSGLSDGTYWAPSLDYRSGGWLVQMHVLDLVGNVTNKTVNLGVDVTKITQKEKIAEDIEGVLMLGGGARVLTNTDFDPLMFNLVGEARMGAERKKKAGIGIYVVPMIGLTNIPTASEEIDLTYGGGVQISTWMK